jgi:hypothetical protein
MNERIEKLELEAAYGVIDPNGPFTPEEFNNFTAKFAELIVRECYETIKKDMELAHIQLIPIDFGIYANGRLRRIIKEHFGVEE